MWPRWRRSLLVIVTILLQGGLVGGEQPYRVFWVWTYFLTQGCRRAAAGAPLRTMPGNPYIWVLYLVAVCALGLVVAVRHDPESDRATLDKVALGLVALAVLLGVLTMTVGFTEGVVSPDVCPVC